MEQPMSTSSSSSTTTSIMTATATTPNNILSSKKPLHFNSFKSTLSASTATTTTPSLRAHSQSQSQSSKPMTHENNYNCIQRKRPSPRRRRHDTFKSSLVLFTYTLTTLFLLSTLPQPIQGKYRLIPKRRKNKQKGTPKTRGGKTAVDSASLASSKHENTMIILKPREETKQKKLQLDATIHTNEQGEQVLMLSPDSSQAVHSAIRGSSTSSTTNTNNNNNAAENEAHGMQLTINTEESTPSMEQKEGDISPGVDNGQKVLFYDPKDLKTSPGELPLPKRVFDEHGNEVDMAGKEALLVKPPPQPKSKSETTNAGGKTKSKTNTNSSNGNNNNNSNTGNGSSSSSSSTGNILQNTTQSQDQMIIMTTIGTMALLVGALSARRLRSRQFLSFCIENESLEDELAYDAAYTTQSTVGASSLYGGMNGESGYDTFASGKYGGDLRWRGDLEKFDV